MRITAIAGDFGGCGFYRIFLPYKILARLRGHEVNASDQFAFNELMLAPTTPTDVVVVQRPGNAGILATLAVGKAQGIPVVAEVDDLLWNIPAWNPAFNVWKTRKQDNKQQMSLTVLKTFLSQADAITVSTEPLAREVRSQWPKKPVYVLPNCLAIGDWPKVDHAARWQGTERATVGWGGSVTHAADLSKVQGLPGQALGGMLHTRLYTFGWVAGAEKYLAPGFAVGRRMHDHWFPLNKIAYAYAKIDIGLAPLDGHRFNESKSALKAIEYGAVCTPTIATDSVTYRPFVRHGENGFLCKDTRDWLRALTVLATDHPKRIEMGLRARADAETMDIAQHVHKWEEVLMEVIARKRREVGMPALAPVQA